MGAISPVKKEGGSLLYLSILFIRITYVDKKGSKLVNATHTLGKKSEIVLHISTTKMDPLENREHTGD